MSAGACAPDLAKAGEPMAAALTIDRDTMIAELATAFGTHPQIWRRMDQSVLDRAHAYMLYRWG